MEPTVAALGILVCVVLLLGAFLGAYLLGRDAERSKTEAAVARAEAAEWSLKREREASSARAVGAVDDLARDRAVSAAPSITRLLRDSFPASSTGPTADQPCDEAGVASADGADG